MGGFFCIMGSFRSPSFFCDSSMTGKLVECIHNLDNKVILLFAHLPLMKWKKEKREGQDRNRSEKKETGKAFGDRREL